MRKCCLYTLSVLNFFPRITINKGVDIIFFAFFSF